MSNDLFAGIGVVPGTFLLPRPDANWTAWACVACDQYTSEPEYWQRVNTLVGHQPSTLRLILPECDLPAPPERIDAIHAAMRDALNVLHPGVTDGFVLLERTTSTGKRLGLVCCVDWSGTATTAQRPSFARPRKPLRRACPRVLPSETAHRLSPATSCSCWMTRSAPSSSRSTPAAASFPRSTTSTSCSRAAMHAAGRSRPTRTKPPSPPP